jgi:hypothetical protein
LLALHAEVEDGGEGAMLFHVFDDFWRWEEEAEDGGGAWEGSAEREGEEGQVSAKRKSSQKNSGDIPSCSEVQKGAQQRI